MREWEEIERRKPLTRLVSRGIHAPSRATVLIQIVHRESATGSYVSLPLSRDSRLRQRIEATFAVEVLDGGVDGPFECGGVCEGLVGEMMRL